MQRIAPLLVLLSLAAPAPSAQAQGAGLRFEQIADHGIRVDGSLRDWRRLRKIAVGQGDDASMRFAVGYDDGGFYLAAEVRDQRMIRTRQPTREEDAIVVTFAMPRTRGAQRYEASEVWIFAGVEGRTAGSAATGNLGRGRLRAVRGARVVEARTQHGYTLEAYVPWRSVPRSAGWEEGRVAVRLQDVDSEARPEVRAAPATANVDARNLDRMPRVVPSGGDHAILHAFLERQGIPGEEPRHDLRGDVCGDGQPERVVHVGRFLLVMGDGYRAGDGYDFLALPVRGAQDVLEAELRDFTNDRKKELRLRVRQHGEGGSRELWSLFRFDCESIRPLFQIEVAKQTSAGRIESRVRVTGRRGAPRIEVSAGRARGIEPGQWREAPATDAEAILLPWGPTLARTYRWDGRTFATLNERANPNPWRPPTRTATVTTMQTERVEPVEPPSRNVRELIAAVRRERRIPRSVRGRFVQDANLAEDRHPERLVVLGKAVVVVGEHFREGRGYFHYDLAVQSAADILDVRTADVTGDGRAEVLVRAVQTLGDVRRELLMVHRFTRSGFPRVLTAEVARQQGERRVENDIQTRRGQLTLAPGSARGWSESTWPWAPDEQQGQVRPLLLPWRDRAVRFRLRGDALVPR